MIEFINQLFGKFGNTLITLLPASPFHGFLNTISLNQQYVRYLNWFIPVGTIVTILNAWLLAIAAFYVYKAIAHWIGVIS